MKLIMKKLTGSLAAALFAALLLAGCPGTNEPAANTGGSQGGNQQETGGQKHPLVGKVVINEVYTYGDQSTIEDLDWVELYNTTKEMKIRATRALSIIILKAYG